MQEQAVVLEVKQVIERETDPMKMGDSDFAAYCSAKVDALSQEVRNVLVVNMAAIIGGAGLSRKPETFGVLRSTTKKQVLDEVWYGLVLTDIKWRASRGGAFDAKVFRAILASLYYQWMPGFLDANSWSELRSAPWQPTKH